MINLIKIIFLVIFISNGLLATEIKVKDEIITGYQLNDKKNQIEFEQLYYNWLNGFTLSLNAQTTKTMGKTSDDQNLNFYIKQDIYRFGGIPEAKKYAKQKNKINKLNLTINKLDNYYYLYDLYLQYKQAKLNYSITKYKIINKQILIDKLETFLKNGIISISDLDEELIALNDLKISKLELESSTKKIKSKWKYKAKTNIEKINLPKLPTLDYKTYMLKNRINIEKENLKLLKSTEKLRKSDNLPQIYIYDNFNKELSTNLNTNTIGIKINYNFSISNRKNIEIARYNSLIKQNSIIVSKQQEKFFYDNIQNKIKINNKKIEVINSILKKYEMLLKRIKKEVKVGLKIESDYKQYENSIKSKKLEKEKFLLEKEQYKLELYKKII